MRTDNDLQLTEEEQYNIKQAITDVLDRVRPRNQQEGAYVAALINPQYHCAKWVAKHEHDQPYVITEEEILNAACKILGATSPEYEPINAAHGNILMSGSVAMVYFEELEEHTPLAVEELGTLKDGRLRITVSAHGGRVKLR